MKLLKRNPARLNCHQLRRAVRRWWGGGWGWVYENRNPLGWAVIIMVILFTMSEAGSIWRWFTAR